jgi:hypothetical protein
MVVTSGGVFRHRCSELRDAVAFELADFSVVQSSVEPVFGAVLLAADELGVRPDIGMMQTTGPAAAFFDTA